MAEVITETDLVSYPGVVVPTNDATLPQVVDLVNGLITDIIGEDLTPIPTRAKTIALEAAARALRYSEGASSVERSIDDWKKVVRYEGPDGRFQPGVYLTESEEAELRGMLATSDTRVGSIKLRVPWGQHVADVY